MWLHEVEKATSEGLISTKRTRQWTNWENVWKLDFFSISQETIEHFSLINSTGNICVWHMLRAITICYTCVKRKLFPLALIEIRVFSKGKANVEPFQSTFKKVHCLHTKVITLMEAYKVEMWNYSAWCEYFYTD